MKIFKTPQSLGKAKNRVKKFLPQSPRHKKELLLSLANDLVLSIVQDRKLQMVIRAYDKKQLIK